MSQIEFLSSQYRPMKALNAVAQHCVEELKKFCHDPTHAFKLKLDLEGTDYQRRVWQALQKIRPGHTLTYGQLAEKLQSSPRAIGNACRRNPIPIIIPCHRVVAQNHIGGFGGKTKGPTLDIKRRLLQFEEHANCLC